MKLSAIAGRGAARDFWDLHTIVTRTSRPLTNFLDAFRRKYPVEDIGHVLPILSPSQWDRIRRDFETWVRIAVEAG